MLGTFSASADLESAVAMAPTVANGSFESAALGNNQTTLAGWTVSDGDIDVLDQSAISSGASEGSKFIDLADGTIKQTISGFTVGNTYVLRIDYRGNPGGGFGILADANVIIDGQERSQGLFGGDIPGIHSKEETDWVVCNGFEFSPSSSSIEIEIISEDSGDNGLLIDNVRILDGGLTQPPVHDFSSLSVDSDGWSRLANWSFELPISNHTSNPENTGPNNDNPHLCGNAISGWRVTRENTDRINGWPNTPNGSKVMDTGGHGPGSIAHSINGLQPNGLYELEFYAARHRFWEYDIVEEDGNDPDDMVSHLWANGELKRVIVRNFANQRADDGYIREAVELQADSSGQITFEIFSMNLLGGNNAFDSFRIIKKQESPVIQNLGTQTANVGDTVSLFVSASDPDNDDLEFEAVGLPNGLTIVRGTGEIQGTTTAAGSFSPQITVDDGHGNEDSMSFSWLVNTVPTVNAISDQLDQVGDSISLQVNANDADDDDLTFTATGLPNNVAINQSSGLITGTGASSGAFSTVVQVDDGNGGVETVSFNWIINGQPALSPIEDQIAELNSSISLSLDADDPENDALTFSSNQLPMGLSINEQTGVIAGTANQSGSYTVQVSVDDGKGGQTSRSFEWIVSAAPTIEPIADITIGRGGELNVELSASDPDGETLQLSATGLPDGTSANNGSLSIDGTVTTVGSSTVVVTVKDPHGLEASETFKISVVSAAVFAEEIDFQTNKVNESINLGVAITGDGGREISFSAENLPPGLTINPINGTITGTLNTKGTYFVKLKLTDANGGSDIISFVWEVEAKSPPTGGGENMIFLPFIGR